MELKINASKLTAEGRTVLKNFGLAVSRYYRAEQKKTEFLPLPFGTPKVRILPRSIETDYIHAWHALLVCRDRELRSTLDEMNTLYRTGLAGVPDDRDDADRDERIAKFRSESFYNLLELVKELVKLGSTLE